MPARLAVIHSGTTLTNDCLYEVLGRLKSIPCKVCLKRVSRQWCMMVNESLESKKHHGIALSAEQFLTASEHNAYRMYPDCAQSGVILPKDRMMRLCVNCPALVDISNATLSQCPFRLEIPQMEGFTMTCLEQAACGRLKAFTWTVDNTTNEANLRQFLKQCYNLKKLNISGKQTTITGSCLLNVNSNLQHLCLQNLHIINPSVLITYLYSRGHKITALRLQLTFDRVNSNQRLLNAISTVCLKRLVSFHWKCYGVNDYTTLKQQFTPQEFDFQTPTLEQQASLFGSPLASYLKHLNVHCDHSCDTAFVHLVTKNPKWQAPLASPLVSLKLTYTVCFSYCKHLSVRMYNDEHIMNFLTQDICPMLQRLQLTHCCAINDANLYKLSQLVSLTTISLHFCPLVQTKGVLRYLHALTVQNTAFPVASLGRVCRQMSIHGKGTATFRGVEIFPAAKAAGVRMDIRNIKQESSLNRRRLIQEVEHE